MKDINKLVEKIKDGNKKAFDEMYLLTAPELYWYCRRLCGNDSDAEDLMQSTYLKAWKKIEQYNGINFTAWLHSIAHNLWINMLKNKRADLLSDEEFEKISEDEMLQPDNQSEQHICHDEIGKIIDETLNEVQRMTVLMYYYDSKSFSEIAKEMDCTECTVRVRLSRAKEKLCQKIKDKNLFSAFFPIMLKNSSQEIECTETLDILRKSILKKISLSAIKIPCIIATISTGIVIGGVTISEIGFPTERMKGDNGIFLYGTTEITSTESEIAETTENIESQISSNETTSNETEVLKEENDMNKMVNTMISTTVAVTTALTTTTAVNTTALAENYVVDVPEITYTEQQYIIPEEMPEFETIEDVENYFKSKGIDFGNATDEELQELYNYFLNSEITSAHWNDDETGAVTIVWNKVEPYRVGAKYDDYVRYIIHNGEAYICGSNELCDVTEYTIPDEIDGYPVVAIGGFAFFNFRELKKITIPNTVRRIGEEAFCSLHNLEEIELSHPGEHSDLQIIKQDAFRGTNLKEVTCFADSDLTKIEQGAFDYCRQLKDFDFSNNRVSLGYQALSLCHSDSYFLPAELMEVSLEDNEELCRKEAYELFADESETFDLYWYSWSYTSLCNNLGLGNNSHPYPGNSNVEFTNKDFIKLPDDIDFDGEVTIKDLALLKMYLIGEMPLRPIQKLSASNDNSINNIDVKSVSRIANKLVKK